MFEIDKVAIDNVFKDALTDSAHPVLRFSLLDDKSGATLKQAIIDTGRKKQTIGAQTGIALEGDFSPLEKYEVEIVAEDNFGQTAKKRVSFRTGRMGMPWEGKWLTDPDYAFAPKTSPVPFVFRKAFEVKKPLKKALVTATALGVYLLKVNGERVGKDYFTPGFTSYKHTLQYDLYDITDMLEKSNELTATVGGGWAAGRFTYSSKSHITCDRQAFLAEIFLQYEDGTQERIVTDESWQLSRGGEYRFADFYDGEVYDGTANERKISWRSAGIFKPEFSPEFAVCTCPVREHETMTVKASFPAANGREHIYDFGQNFAGVVKLKIRGKRGQKIVVRHAEILTDGDLNVKSLRTAKATAVYICRDGEQEYSPAMTYMGFRYIGIEGIEPKDIEVEAVALYSDMEETGGFECSNALINKLQSNILWSAKSNFVDIPTDCPQRDERMGWTGDISVFARTACFDFDFSAFAEKWLRDLRSEQGRGGGFPLVVPKQGIAAPTVATACWGDCCILVPWAEYLARGDKGLLERMYPTMQKFLKAVAFWARLSGSGKYRRHIWKWLFQFGDWCAPEGGIADWMKRGRQIATAYYANSCRIVSEIAYILGKSEDAKYYASLSEKISEAFRRVFTDGKGTLKAEFQTGYVLPLAFGMAKENERETMAQNLLRLVKQKDMHLTTGFTGTPHILFALADNGCADAAYALLLQKSAPSWLYCVEHGATTTWEQWTIDDKKEGNIPSFNHYAYGAVGDFLYRRVAGIEPIEGGYKKFAVKPVPGGGVTYAKAHVVTPYGRAESCWRIGEGKFKLAVTVPVSCECEITLPSGENFSACSGKYEFECKAEECR